jgi:hypothetical protein
MAAAFAGDSLHFWSAVGKPPNLLLPDAYAGAVKALGANTNQFYCASAQCIDLASSTGSNGEWSLAFFDTKGNAKTVHVLFDKTIHIEEGYAQLGPLLWRSFDRRPSLALPDAYACAFAAFGADTNQLYFTKAACYGKQLPVDDEWSFRFVSAKGTAKTAYVLFDGTTRIPN